MNIKHNSVSLKTDIAIDIAGPLYARDSYSKDKQSYKCYIILFSSASTHAIR